MGFLRVLFKSDRRSVVTVVSGLPRSGTSMVMKMLQAGGIPLLKDDVRPPDPDNPGGYYEFERVKQLDKGDIAWVADARGKAVKVVSPLLEYLPRGYRYRVIFLSRGMDEILVSQRKMLNRLGADPDPTDDAVMAARFERHLARVEGWLSRQPHMRVLYVRHRDVLADPQPQAARINAFCGGYLNEAAMAEVVEPHLYRSRT